MGHLNGVIRRFGAQPFGDGRENDRGDFGGKKEVKSMKVCSAYGGHEVEVKLYCEKGNCC